MVAVFLLIGAVIVMVGTIIRASLLESKNTQLADECARIASEREANWRLADERAKSIKSLSESLLTAEQIARDSRRIADETRLAFTAQSCRASAAESGVRELSAQVNSLRDIVVARDETIHKYEHKLAHAEQSVRDGVARAIRDHEHIKSLAKLLAKYKDEYEETYSKLIDASADVVVHRSQLEQFWELTRNIERRGKDINAARDVAMTMHPPFNANADDRIVKDTLTMVCDE